MHDLIDGIVGKAVTEIEGNHYDIMIKWEGCVIYHTAREKQSEELMN